MIRPVVFAAVAAAAVSASAGDPPPRPVPLIFDTDIGNDCDDVLALAMIHSLQSRGECRLLAVTTTKDHPLAAPFVDAVNTFYGRGDVPVGVCRSGVTPQDGTYLKLAAERDGGQLRYPHDLRSGDDAPPAVDVLRRTLSAAEDGSVVIVQVGFSTNMADLLRSPGDDLSPLSGTELVRKKVRLLSLMAAAFRPIPNRPSDGQGRFAEYNVIKDVPSAQKLADDWPTPAVWSGFEVGFNLTYPEQSIERDYAYAKHHPVEEAYRLYKFPHDRPTWDLTSVLQAVRPDRGYFGLSEPGRVAVEDAGVITFTPAPDGRDRHLILGDSAQQERVREALVQLSSQPPTGEPAAAGPQR